MKEYKIPLTTERGRLGEDVVNNAGTEKAIACMLGISEEGVRTLRDRIEKAHGMLRVFVHPYWAHEPGEKRYKGAESDVRAINRFRTRLGVQKHMLQAQSDPRSAPVLILEDGSKIPWLKKNYVDEKSVFIMESREGFPDKFWESLKFLGSRKAPFKEWKEVDRFHEPLKLMLEYLHVSKLLVGGMYLEKEEDTFFDGCVSDILLAAHESGIPVTLSRYQGSSDEMKTKDHVRAFARKRKKAL